MSVFRGGRIPLPALALHPGYVSGQSYATAPDGPVLTSQAVAAVDTVYGYLWFNT